MARTAAGVRDNGRNPRTGSAARRADGPGGRCGRRRHRPPIVGLLGACLVALVLVLVARREAGMQRTRAERDVASIKDEARAMLRGRRAPRAAADRARAAARGRPRRDRRARAPHARRRRRGRGGPPGERARSLEESERAAAPRAAGAERAARAELEAVSGLTADDARAELTRRIVAQAQNDAAAQVRRAEAQARRPRRRGRGASSRRPCSGSRSRPARSRRSPCCRCPSDEMKGRIIGKEGRNIRSFEALTGVNVLVDDQPDAVVLSCFDTERREVAQVALEALMADGRIHPQRIEQAYAEALAGADERTDSAGHDAAERAGVSGLHPTLVRTLGRLRLRTSYGQNVLEHLVETALLAAAPRRGDRRGRRGRPGAGRSCTTSARRSPRRCPGTHARARRRPRAPARRVRRPSSTRSPRTTTRCRRRRSRRCSCRSRTRSRRPAPGRAARSSDQYVERIDKLEQLVAAHAGVRRALAMSAGREVRVVVEPSEVDDYALPQLAVAIARHIEADLAYPGEIKVTVVREMRASATAG